MNASQYGHFSTGVLWIVSLVKIKTRTCSFAAIREKMFCGDFEEIYINKKVIIKLGGILVNYNLE